MDADHDGIHRVPQAMNVVAGRLTGYPPGITGPGGYPSVEGCGAFGDDKRPAGCNILDKRFILSASLLLANAGYYFEPVSF
jgi:hypothetical protein